MEDEIVYLVKTECDFMPHGMPHDMHGANVRLVTKDLHKAFVKFEEYRKSLNKFMENNRFRVKIGDDFREGDHSYWAIWEHNNGSGHQVTRVVIERHKIE